ILENRLRRTQKSVLLLMKPDLTIDLADEEQYREHVKDPGLLKRIVAAEAPSLVLLDEIQRIPSTLNSVQALIDKNKRLRFLITASSARKLRRGQANLLPGRVLLETLPPLVYWEILITHFACKVIAMKAAWKSTSFLKRQSDSLRSRSSRMLAWMSEV